MTAGQDTPYEATVALLAWFRGDRGNFVYTEQPRIDLSKPPLVAFLENREGYCQHFAGAMALMLRYLGIPSRVAVGFTTGTYLANRKEWIVTDHNAHAWVEVYFPGFGWLQFDPTPSRGQLDAAYDPFSDGFADREAAQLGQTFLDIPEVGERAALLQAREAQAGGAGNAVTGQVTKRGGSVVFLVLLIAVGAAPRRRPAQGGPAADPAALARPALRRVRVPARPGRLPRRPGAGRAAERDAERAGRPGAALLRRGRVPVRLGAHDRALRAAGGGRAGRTAGRAASSGRFDGGSAAPTGSSAACAAP